MEQSRTRGITIRAIAIGAVLSILHTAWLVYEEAMLGHIGMTSIFIPVRTVIGLVFLLTLANAFLKRKAPSAMFSPAEIMVVFSMTTLSAVISSGLLLHLLFPVILWPLYMSSSVKDYHTLLPYLPSYFGPGNEALVKEFFNGSHRFWRFFEPEVLRAWAVPMMYWGTFLFLLVWTMACLGAILRRQWVDNEKITFPVIELPVMMAKESTATAILSNRLLLIGFAVTAVAISMNYLSAIFPSVPQIPLAEGDIGKKLFLSPPLVAMNPVVISWWPYAIGLCFLIPLDILFSCWFFYVAIRLSIVVVTMLGWREPWPGLPPTVYPYIHNASQGAWVGLFIAVMWSARGHLASVWRAAVSPQKTRGDQGEPMSYRNALAGSAIGFVLLVVMAAASGMRLQIAAMFFAIYFLTTVVMTRIYAQLAVPIFSTGLFYSSTTFLTSLTGTGGLSAADSTLISGYAWFNFGYGQHPMAHEMESVVFAERLGQSRRKMLRVALLALAIGIVVGMVTYLQLIYNHGAASAQVNGGPAWVADLTWRTRMTSAASPQPVQLATIGRIAVSVCIVLILAWLRNFWFASPFHPVGYVFACSGALEYIWNTMLVIWVVKSLIIRYGGLRLYRQVLPLFYGIVLGDAVAQFVWGIAMAILGVKGASAYGPASM